MATVICPSCRQTIEGVVGPLAICPFCGASLAPPPQTYDRQRGIDLRQVARRQRAILWYILASLVLQVLLFTPIGSFHPLVALFILLAFLALQIMIVVGVVQLLAALGVGIIWRILCIVLLFAPCISLLTLLVINSRATRALRDAGLRVRLMGVRDADVLRALSVHLCHNCGYNLTGNVSGRCPECGTPIARPVNLAR
jgi:hypothetical protein